MNPNWYLIAIMTILAGEWLLRTIVDILNMHHVTPELPAEFEGIYDAEKYRKSQEYLRENTRFDLRMDALMTVGTIAFILLGGFNMTDRIARGLGFGELITGLVFAGILLLISQVVHIPFSVYETFVIEEKYGYNRTTARTYVLDLIKVWILTGVIGGPVLAAVLWFFANAGAFAWLYCWVAVTAFQLFAAFVFPVVIMPLFNKFVPLPEGELRTAIETYANSQAFTMKGVFSMDGSKRSSKSNAFFTGLGRFRRLVLLDTLISRHTTPELVAVIAHEMGHFKKKHVLLQLLLAVGISGLSFFLLSFFLNNRGLFSAFRMDHLSIYAGLIFFGFLYSPIMTLISVLSSALSRHWEYAADAYAVSSYGDGEALTSALKKLSVDNLSNLTPHPLKVIMDYSHPPILERLRFIADRITHPSRT